MNRALIIVLGGCLAFATTNLAAQTERPQTTLPSFPDLSCSAWVASKKEPLLRSHYIVWLRGFISGHNLDAHHTRIRPDQLPTTEAITQQVDRYCSDNPTRAFTNGAFPLFKEIKTARNP